MQFSKKLSLGILAVSLMAAAASAQTISIVSGDGQIALQNNIAQSPMVAIVRNAVGQPLPGVAVTWTIISGQGNLVPQPNSYITDANGQASMSFFGGTLFGTNFSQTVINASVSTSSVNFTQTTSGVVDPNSPNAAVVQVQVAFPTLADIVTGAAGSTGTTPIKAQVFATGIGGFQTIPNVVLKLVPVDPNGPQIACAGDTGRTDFSGNVNCFPVFSGQPSSGRYNIDVGGAYRVLGPYSFTVTAGQISTFRILSGNNQTGAPNTTLPLVLSARAEDPAGGPLPNVPVVWEAVVPNTVTITNASTQTDATGTATATVTLGNTSGNVQVRLRNAANTAQTTFSFQVNVPVTGLSKVAGDSQVAITNTTFAQPLIVQVSTNQGTAAGVQVQFSATAGVLFPSGAVATTDAQGRASVTVQAGATPTTAIVTASVGAFSTSFTLTIRLPGPQITSSSFFNGAGGQPGGVSPTAVLAIYGGGLATGIQGCISGNQIFGPLPLLVSNVTVQFASAGLSLFAPIYAVCNLGVGQEYVVVQVPAELPLGATSVTVRVGTGSTTLDNIPVVPASPGVFETVMSDGRKRAVLQHADGSFVTLQNPALRGERISAFVTGLGRPVTASGVRLGSNQSGSAADIAGPPAQVQVGVADQGVTVISTEYAPGLIGVYVVTFEVPANAPSGNDLNFSVASVLNDNPVFSNPSKIPVQ